MIRLLLRLSQLRNWRVVEAKDSEGVKRMCFLVPMEMNGMFMSKRSGLPFMRFNVFPIGKNRSSTYSYGIQPLIPYPVRDKLVEEGIINPEDKIFSPACGGIQFAKGGKRKSDANL